jgi:hypothetical protein
MVTEGRFAGRHIDEVMLYLEGLEAAAVSNNNAQPAGQAPTQPPAAPAAPKPAAQQLADDNASRTEQLLFSVVQRAEQDDEAAFGATVTDYSKYKEAIDKLKTNMPPQTRASKGLHRSLYIHVKSQDPQVSSRVFEAVPEAPADGVAAGNGAPPVAQPPQAPPRPLGAAPPMASPTPTSRSVVPAATTQSRLIATDKIKEFCRSNRLDLNQYLLRLEGEGRTQQDLDSAGQMGKRDTTSNIAAYGRNRAARRE